MGQRKKKTLIDERLEQTKVIVTTISTKTTAEIGLSFYLELVTREANKERLLQTSLFGFLGKKLVYIRALRGLLKLIDRPYPNERRLMQRSLKP